MQNILTTMLQEDYKAVNTSIVSISCEIITTIWRASHLEDIKNMIKHVLAILETYMETRLKHDENAAPYSSLFISLFLIYHITSLSKITQIIS